MWHNLKPSLCIRGIDELLNDLPDPSNHTRIFFESIKEFVYIACDTSEAGLLHFEKRIFERLPDEEKEGIENDQGRRLKGDVLHIVMLGFRQLMSDSRMARRDVVSFMDWLFLSDVLNVQMQKTDCGEWPLTKIQLLDRYLGLLMVYKISSSKNCYFNKYEDCDDQYALCLALMLLGYGHPCFACMGALDYARFRQNGRVTFELPSVDWTTGEYGLDFCIKNDGGGIVEFFSSSSSSSFSFVHSCKKTTQLPPAGRPKKKKSRSSRKQR